MTDWFDKTNVKMLNGADFENDEPWKLKDKRCAVILFFADWCGHCKNLKPDYVKFADEAQFVRVHAVDTDKESELMARLSKKGPVKVTGFPTIWLYKEGEPMKKAYDGPRTSEGLMKAAKKVCNEKCTCDKVKKKRVVRRRVKKN
jgi:thiol-disulfide isomerase/thioredoxin